MAYIPLVLLVLMSSLSFHWAVYTGPLQPELSNGTFHHFFVPDGDYEDNYDPEQCQMLFKFADRRACGVHHDEDSDLVVRDDFIIVKYQIEDAARLLESIGRSISHDLDGGDSYGKFLTEEITQITEAFTSVDKTLMELEVKFKQSQDNGLRGESQLNDYLLKSIYEVKDGLRETTDISLGLKDKHELLSLIVRSQGTRLSRLKTDYLNDRLHSEFVGIKRQIIVCMEELDQLPDTSLERDVVCEDEEAFCLSNDNIADLQLLLGQLEDRKPENELVFISHRSKFQELWERLRVPQEEREGMSEHMVQFRKKNMDALEKTLKTQIDLWEEEQHRDFLVNGQKFLQYVQEHCGNYYDWRRESEE